MDQSEIRVLLVDDHAIVRKGIGALLAEVKGITVVGEARDGREAVEQVQALKPDVILMDLVMPGMDGIEATRQITASSDTARVLVLTSFAADDKVFPSIKAGALGYLLKDSEPGDLVRAIQQVHRGEPTLQASIARRVLQEMQRPSRDPPTPDPLTDREMEVLREVATGLTNAEVAERLWVTQATVRSHVSNILAKLHLATACRRPCTLCRRALSRWTIGRRTGRGSWPFANAVVAKAAMDGVGPIHICADRTPPSGLVCGASNHSCGR
jgi:NarL family two-component system response regulator LiaR